MSSDYPTQYSAQEIWNRVFDASTNAIKTTSNANVNYATKYTGQEVLNLAFDATNNALNTR